jgi:hypothetical protein
MTKLGEVVLQTQQAETAFETNALWKLADMAAHPNPVTDESDFIGLKLYAMTVRDMGRNTDELVALETAHREPAQ